MNVSGPRGPVFGRAKNSARRGISFWSQEPESRSQEGLIQEYAGSLKGGILELQPLVTEVVITFETRCFPGSSTS